MKISRFLKIFLTCLAVVVIGTYYYVFIAGTPQLDLPRSVGHTGLTFKIESFQSQAMQSERRYGLVLPYGYNHNSQQRYPVIFLLHGGHGNERDYQDKGLLTSVLHNLYQKMHLPPTIVISPDGNDRRGTSPFWDPQYYDGVNGKVGTLIGSELVQIVKSRYRTFDNPKYWAIGGLSSGGWGALNIGLHNINNFNIMFSHSGYFMSKSGSGNSPLEYIKMLPVPSRKRLRIYLDAGQQDGEFLVSTCQFHQQLNQLNIDNQFHIFPGGHGIIGSDVGWNYWHKHLYNSLQYVGQQFNQASSE